jgi:chromosome segregation ATPase
VGLIRKTLSITTLGLVGWKSKKELLRETEADLAATRAELEETSALRAALEDRLGTTERKLSAAEVEAVGAAKKARRAERRRQQRERLEAKLGSVTHEAEARAHETRAKLEKTTRKARKQAEKTAKEARKRAEHLADEARAKVHR